MNNKKLAYGYIFLALAAGATAVPIVLAQFAQRQPTPNDTLVSPEVLDDNRVAFRIYAPKAEEVSVTGDWISQGLGERGDLQKDDEGVWSITVGPLPSDFYSYSFNVDGVKTLDPKNATVKQGIRSLDNMFLVPGEEAAFQSNKPVPHGDIRQVWYPSSTLGTQRRMHVYTPPGYDRETRRYPVLYLFHGGGDEDSGWSTIGRAGFILDNLLAAEQARPMLIVMPNGSLPRREVAPGTSPADLAALRSEVQNRFTSELLTDVVPFVEKTFRADPHADSRAIAGLSMGGGQTLRVITSHSDAFAHVAIWSAGLFRQSAVDFESDNGAFLEQADAVNESVKVFSIVVGDRDFALEGSQSLSEVLKKHDIKHDLHISGGGHTWINWRRYLHAYLPLLFQ